MMWGLPASGVLQASQRFCELIRESLELMSPDFLTHSGPEATRLEATCDQMMALQSQQTLTTQRFIRSTC